MKKTHIPKRLLGYTLLKVDGATPKGGLERGHDKPMHGSCAIYFPGGISFSMNTGINSRSPAGGHHDAMEFQSTFWRLGADILVEDG